MFTIKDGDHFTIIVAYIDDLLVTSSHLPTIQSLKKALNNTFTIKDLGELKQCLGIKVIRSDAGILLNQRKHVQLICCKKLRWSFVMLLLFHFLKV